MMVTPLCETEARVYYVHTEDANGRALLDSYAALLSEAEREQLGRITVESVRHEYLVSRALVRASLSLHVAVAPSDWTFLRDRHGKPALAGPGIDQAIQFNLSHTSGLVACVIAVGCEVGIDVEDRWRSTDLNAMQDQFLTPAEAACLRHLHPETQRQRLLEHWTLKEAYSKGRGVGLTLPLDQVWLEIEAEDRIHLGLGPAAADDPRGWQLRLYRWTDRHQGAVAIHRGAAADRRILTERVLPLRWRSER